MNPQEREHLSSIVKQSNEVIMAHPSVPHMQAHYTIIPQPLASGLPHPQCTAPHLVTPPLNLNEIVSTHVKSQCPECGKYLANVNEHMKLVHRKIRNHACPSCDYRACFKNDLEKHMRSVHGMKHEAALSEAAAGQAQVFIALKSESVEPFEELGKPPHGHDHKSKQCPYCSKSLANTKEHIKAVHLKEKNYFCQHCDYKTLFKSDLLKHEQLVHMKIKKSCTHCGKQVANLHEHIRLVHKKEKRFKCNYCGYVCAKQSDMKKHTRNVHKVHI